MNLFSVLRYVLLFFAISLLTYFVLYPDRLIQSAYIDFQSNYTAIHFINQGNLKNLYNLNLQFAYQKSVFPWVHSLRGTLPFISFPFAIVFLYPFAKFDFLHAFSLWTLSSILIITGVNYAISKTTIEKKLAGYSLWCLTIAFAPVRAALLLGQYSFLLMGFLVLAYFFHKKNKEFATGLFFALLIIKPQYLLIPVLIFLIKRQWKILAGIIAGSSFALVISYVLVGYNGLISYATFSRNILSWGNAYGIKPQFQITWNALVNILLGTFSITTVATVLWIIGCVLTIFVMSHVWNDVFVSKKKSHAYFYLQVGLAIIFVSLHSHDHDLVMLFPFAILLFGEYLKNKRLLDRYYALPVLIMGVLIVSEFLHIYRFIIPLGIFVYYIWYVSQLLSKKIPVNEKKRSHK